MKVKQINRTQPRNGRDRYFEKREVPTRFENPIHFFGQGPSLVARKCLEAECGNYPIGARISKRVVQYVFFNNRVMGFQPSRLEASAHTHNMRNIQSNDLDAL